MEEFAELLLPVTDPRHQTVEQLVQLLAERNKDIPEVSDVPWSVHVVDSPNINAFVLPVSKRKDVGKLFFFCFSVVHFLHGRVQSLQKKHVAQMCIVFCFV